MGEIREALSEVKDCSTREEFFYFMDNCLG